MPDSGPSQKTSFLIVGAGPFGLAMAAEASRRGVEHMVLGRPMSFWRDHMPEGMVLRSASDWHLDPADDATIERFLAERGQTPADVEPLSLDLYLEYADWFRREKQIETRSSRVVRLDRADGTSGTLTAQLDDGSVVHADAVLLAIGFAPFAHIPAELEALIPADRASHSVDLVSPADYEGRRVLIVGGRQSAFESAVLLAEAGARRVDVCLRHEMPEFVESDWSWVQNLLDRIAADPAWFRALSTEEREALDHRFWVEGRRKLEPWLDPRLQHPAIRTHPETQVVRCEIEDDGLQLTLDSGETVEVDEVIYATGYQVDLDRVPCLRAGGLLPSIERRDGFPVLDEALQTTVPGLFMTSLPAVKAFGLFFAFTVSVRASARLIGARLAGSG